MYINIRKRNRMDSLWFPPKAFGEYMYCVYLYTIVTCMYVYVCFFPIPLSFPLDFVCARCCFFVVFFLTSRPNVYLYDIKFVVRIAPGLILGLFSRPFCLLLLFVCKLICSLGFYLIFSVFCHTTFKSILLLFFCSPRETPCIYVYVYNFL